MTKQSRSDSGREPGLPARCASALLVTMMSALAVAALPPTTAGFPDPTYATGGAGVFSTNSGNDAARTIAPMPSGHWLIAGSIGGLNDTRYLARLLPDGRLDLSFGRNGFVTDRYDSANLAVQASGKILSTGGTPLAGGMTAAMLVRLQPDGTRDTAFGEGGGVTVLDTVVAATPFQTFESLANDREGRIIGTAVRARFDGFDTVASVVEVWRFSTDGIRDSSFGTNGRVVLDDVGEVVGDSVMRLQADGKLVVAANCAAVCIVRLNANGTRDTTFGPSGVRRIVTSGYWLLRNLAVAPDGSIYVIVGDSVHRMKSDGTPDITYGDAGIAGPALPASSMQSIHVLPDGKQIVVGKAVPSVFEAYGYVLRLTANGLLDPAFGVGGIAARAVAENHAFNGGTVLADGAILAIGSVAADSVLVRIIGVETTTNVIEFYNTALKHYFVTADPVEAASIDTGAAGPGWTRTGKTWKSGGPSRACRSYGSSDVDPATGVRRGPNSHVFSMEAAECLTIRADPGWRFEGYGFSGWPRRAQGCASGTIGVYRAYNNRFAFNDSNHRHTTELATYNQMIGQGWAGEGIVFCAVE
jgi:uncharacterized delta-60 repeat protein